MTSNFGLFSVTTLIFITSFSLFSSSVSARQFSGGDGTSGNPYLVASATELNEIRNNLSSYFELAANIDMDVSPYNTGD